MQPIKVKILDHEYLVKSEENIEQVYRIADYVSDKLNEIKVKAEGLSDRKTAILVALNIASEYFQVLKERDEMEVQIRERAEKLINHIDSEIG